MKILITIIKLFIAFTVGNIIFFMNKSENTSSIQALALNSKGFVNKVFSKSQLNSIEVSFKKLSIPYNTITILALVGVGIAISSVIFALCRLMFPLKSIAFIIAFPTILLPLWIIKYISNNEQNKLEAGLNDFFIQLKSALKVNSDIVEALRRIQNTVIEPFSSYTKQLLVEINAGKLPEKALESFAFKINIKKFSFYINNVRYCQIYGGDIITLTEKTQITLSEAIKQRKKRIKEAKSICVVLYVLIVIDIYMYFYFINGSEYYLNIMTSSLLGRLILNVNFLSLWGVLWLSRVIRKLDY